MCSGINDNCNIYWSDWFIDCKHKLDLQTVGFFVYQSLSLEHLWDKIQQFYGANQTK